MSESPTEERTPRTGDTCVVTGEWQSSDDDQQLVDVNRGATFLVCPFCGRAIGWTYLHE